MRMLIILGIALFAVSAVAGCAMAPPPPTTVAVVPLQSVPPNQWCDGAYDPKLGPNFAPCPGPTR
jgi:hypothetical protein